NSIIKLKRHAMLPSAIRFLISVVMPNTEKPWQESWRNGRSMPPSKCCRHR
ncbi:uncharacterized protein METZ01_LOCUS250884, partial [marine metagenome]